MICHVQLKIESYLPNLHLKPALIELKSIIMNVQEIINGIDAFQTNIEQVHLSTKSLLKLLPSFRLDWGLDEGPMATDFNIGATKPILLSKLANSESPIGRENLLQKSNEIVQLLSDTFFVKGKLTKNLLLDIHAKIIPNGGQWRHEDVFVNGQSFALGTTFSEIDAIESQVVDLIDWYNKVSESREFHSLLVCTLFHYNFVRIHPFIDGNGRLARIISSLMLLANRIPPPMVNKDDRIQYIHSLRKADLGDFDPLLEFIGQRVIASLEFILTSNG